MDLAIQTLTILAIIFLAGSALAEAFGPKGDRL